MRKIGIIAALTMLASSSVAFAAVTVTTQPLSLVTSPATALPSSSSQALFKFVLGTDAADTLSSVALTINTNGTAVTTGSDLANVAVYRDANANGTFESGTDTLVASQTSVNVGSATTITTASGNTLPGTFFVTLSTGASWSATAPADSITASIAANGVTTTGTSPTLTPATTSTITAIAAATPTLSTAVASNSGTKSVALTFSSATNSPVINAANINSALALNNSHSWLDGNGAIGSAVWNGTGTVLTINLSSAISNPTLAVGDTVTVTGSTIKDITATNNATGTLAITGSFTVPSTSALTTAVAANTGSNTGIGAGDTVALTFSTATNKPTINASNINSVLMLNNTHSWLDGALAIGSTAWSADGKTLTITLSAGTSVPTVAVGDTVTVTGSTIKDTTGTNNATGTASITGSFSGTVSTGGGEGDDDEGQGHACANNLINGRLYKLAGDANTTVYLAAACRLKPFRGAAVFHARGNKFQNIIVLATLPEGAVSTDPALPATGTLVKGSDKTVWFVETGHKRKGFASSAAFLGLGFKFSQVAQISDSDLTTMPVDSDAITDASHHPNGALVKCTTSPTVAQVSGSTLVPFANVDSFTLRGHTFAQVATINCTVYKYVATAPITQ